MSTWTPPAHEGNCGGTLCGFCGCCCHSTDATTCRIYSAPAGLPCKDTGCGCEGMS